MPDHPDTVKDLADNIQILETLVNRHDVIFLCTDNKESRWLPTIIALSANKPLVNLAVGFDSWVVMRHPLASTSSLPKSSYHQEKDQLPIDQIGCYFCTSIEGVVNTVKDRQIDERCTVTRGGTSAVSSAYAVELAISLLTHPDGFFASAEIDNQSRSSLTVKYPPQQIRGTISCFNIKQCLARRNPQCCACSGDIMNCYNNRLTRLKFLETVCQNSQILKKITSLDQFEIMTSKDNLLEIDEQSFQNTGN